MVSPTTFMLLLLTVAASSATSTIFLDINATHIRHLDWVRVTFGGLKPNDSTAWLGVFSPSTASTATIPEQTCSYCNPPWTQNAPLKFIMCGDIPGCLENGEAYFDFRLENCFEDMKIALFTGGIETPIVLAESNAISFEDIDFPLRGHLTRTQSPSEMMVVWATREMNAGAGVKWGSSPGGAYTSFAPVSESRTHTLADLCGKPANEHGWFDPHYWNYATITGLTPGVSLVYYVYGSDEHGWSEEESFLAVPPTGPDISVHMVLVADVGMSEYEDKVQNGYYMPESGLTFQYAADEVLSGSGYDYSLFLHVGDLVYAMGYLLKWELMLSKVTSLGIGGRVPYVVNQGNHERDFPNSGIGSSLYPSSKDSGGECGVPTELRFPTAMAPADEHGDGGWYSFTHGPATIVMINTEALINSTSLQYAFIKSALSSVNRTQTPWVIVSGHRPMYYVYSKGGRIDPIYQVIEELMLDYKVDLVVGAHVHNTFASCAVYNATCISPEVEGGYDAPVYVGIGNGGANLDLVGNSTNTPAWVKYQASEHGFNTISLNSTNLSMKWHSDAGNQIHFVLSINRKYPRV